jgi:hypothetical protein
VLTKRVLGLDGQGSAVLRTGPTRYAGSLTPGLTVTNLDRTLPSEELLGEWDMPLVFGDVTVEGGDPFGTVELFLEAPVTADQFHATPTFDHDPVASTREDGDLRIVWLHDDGEVTGADGFGHGVEVASSPDGPWAPCTEYVYPDLAHVSDTYVRLKVIASKNWAGLGNTWPYREVTRHTNVVGPLEGDWRVVQGPVFNSAPSISGTPKVGEVIAVDDGDPRLDGGLGDPVPLAVDNPEFDPFGHYFWTFAYLHSSSPDVDPVTGLFLNWNAIFSWNNPATNPSAPIPGSLVGKYVQITAQLWSGPGAIAAPGQGSNVIGPIAP